MLDDTKLPSVEADAGTEWLLPWARNQLLALQRLREDLDIEFMHRTWFVNGVRVRVESNVFNDVIRLKGRQRGMWYMITPPAAATPVYYSVLLAPGLDPAVARTRAAALPRIPSPSPFTGAAGGLVPLVFSDESYIGLALRASDPQRLSALVRTATGTPSATALLPANTLGQAFPRAEVLRNAVVPTQGWEMAGVPDVTVLDAESVPAQYAALGARFTSPAFGRIIDGVFYRAETRADLPTLSPAPARGNSLGPLTGRSYLSPWADVLVLGTFGGQLWGCALLYEVVTYNEVSGGFTATYRRTSKAFQMSGGTPVTLGESTVTTTGDSSDFIAGVPFLAAGAYSADGRRQFLLAALWQASTVAFAPGLYFGSAFRVFVDGAQVATSTPALRAMVHSGGSLAFIAGTNAGEWVAAAGFRYLPGDEGFMVTTSSGDVALPSLAALGAPQPLNGVFSLPDHPVFLVLAGNAGLLRAYLLYRNTPVASIRHPSTGTAQDARVAGASSVGGMVLENVTSSRDDIGEFTDIRFRFWMLGASVVVIPGKVRLRGGVVSVAESRFDAAQFEIVYAPPPAGQTIRTSTDVLLTGLCAFQELADLEAIVLDPPSDRVFAIANAFVAIAP